MTISRWTWVILPLILGVGALGGVVATQQVLIQKMERQAQAAADALAQAARSQPPAALAPTPVTDPAPSATTPERPRSPFAVEGQNLVSQPPPKTEPPIHLAEEPPIQVKPPLVVRNGVVDLDPPPGYFDLPAPNKNDGTDPPIIKAGQVIQVEALEALPARPITGEHVVRPDGTIGLGFYGDLRVAGLNRYQIKVKLIEHLRKSLTDQALGLFKIDLTSGQVTAILPVESDRVFVDESINYEPTARGIRPAASKPADEGRVGKPEPDRAEVEELRSKVEALTRELEGLRGKPVAAPGDKPG